jgi:hypothetical protein
MLLAAVLGSLLGGATVARAECGDWLASHSAVSLQRHADHATYHLPLNDRGAPACRSAPLPKPLLPSVTVERIERAMAVQTVAVPAVAAIAVGCICEPLFRGGLSRSVLERPPRA